MEEARMVLIAISQCQILQWIKKGRITQVEFSLVVPHSCWHLKYVIVASHYSFINTANNDNNILIACAYWSKNGLLLVEASSIPKGTVICMAPDCLVASCLKSKTRPLSWPWSVDFTSQHPVSLTWNLMWVMVSFITRDPLRKALWANQIEVDMDYGYHNNFLLSIFVLQSQEQVLMCCYPTQGTEHEIFGKYPWKYREGNASVERKSNC